MDSLDQPVVKDHSVLQVNPETWEVRDHLDLPEWQDQQDQAAFRVRQELTASLDLLGNLVQSDLRVQLVQLDPQVRTVIEGTLDLLDQVANQVHLVGASNLIY